MANKSNLYFLQETLSQKLSGAMTLEQAVVELAKNRLVSTTTSFVIVDNDGYIVPMSEWFNLVQKITIK